MSKPVLHVTHFQRLPSSAQFSVERYFDSVRPHFSERVSVVKKVMPCASRGVIGRLRNCWNAYKKRSAINHVTGDINYIALALPRRNTVLTVLDCQVLTRLKGWKRWIVQTLWFSLPSARVRLITVISQATKDALVAEVGVAPEKVLVIPVPISPGFEAKPKPMNEECPRILQLGTKDNKNLPRLIEALSGIDCVLDVVGPLSVEHKQLLQRYGIQYTNATRLTDQEIIERYEQCDLVAFVSTYEGFGMPIVEAQWIERPVVTSNCWSMPEVAGEGACLVDPLDVASIRAGILRVIRDTEYRETILRKGRENRERFRPELIARQFEELYREMAEERRAKSEERRAKSEERRAKSEERRA